MVKRVALVLAALAILALAVGGYAAWHTASDARYQRRCIDHASDIPLCDMGRAAGPRRHCDHGEWPPGVTPNGGIAVCVRAWLAQEH